MRDAPQSQIGLINSARTLRGPRPPFLFVAKLLTFTELVAEAAANTAGSRHTTPGQRCRIQDICERSGEQRPLVCGGRPGRRWRAHARSRSVRRWFGIAACARGGAGCRAWAFHPLARPHENTLALGVRWLAWGSASRGWVPDDAVYKYSIMDLSATLNVSYQAIIFVSATSAAGLRLYDSSTHPIVNTSVATRILCVK